MDMLATLVAGADADLLLPAALALAALFVGATAVWSTLSERVRLRRRAAAPGAIVDTLTTEDESRRAGAGERKRAAKMLAHVAENFVPDDAKQVAQLKRRLLQAGFLKPSAVATFFLARGIGAVVFGLGAAIALDIFAVSSQRYFLGIGAALVLGYMAPTVWLDRRIKQNAIAHRFGFPDFMDLMVVCADSGLAMEAALERVGRELAPTHPSLAANLAMATLEMRAGRRLGEALEHLADRLGIDEARAFATLLQQSEELGSSMTEALRVYSDDMRHQRLMRAEEKAYALPAKLVIPLGIFIFPIVMVVALMPVIIRVKSGMMGG